MATLQVRSAEFSVTRRKAFDDAVKMQSIIADECSRTGKDVPPYELLELIGKGSYGRVYKAKDLGSAQLVAVKIIDIEESDTLDPKRADTYSEFLKEISALKLLRDGGAKNVNYLLDALPVGQSMWMITEYCAGGSVATLMQPTSPGGLQEKWIIPIIREVAEAIYWVHRQGIIHRDIKCANVLVTEAGGVQLCDFGVAGVIETKFDKRSTVIGTPHWMAPEMFDHSASYGTEVDIWAFGSMVFEIASGLPPNVVQGVTYHQLGNYLKTHTPRLEGDKYSPQLKDLVAFCLADDPAQRPPIEQVQCHPYIFETSNRYPTEMLAMLVKGYRVWESQGGMRRSLFAPGGAQGPLPFDSQLAVQAALANEEWNFSTTLDFDRSVLESPDSQQAVYDVYGLKVGSEDGGVENGNESSVSLPNLPTFKEENSRYGGGRGGRRRQLPPQLPVIKAPLEKVFDPDTMTNYEDNSRTYYGAPVPPPTATPAASDLPLRDDSLYLTLRESLIDLDASFDLGLGMETPQFADMETIRAGSSNAAPRESMDYSFSFGGDAAKKEGSSFDAKNDNDEYYSLPPGDPANLHTNRRTQEWKFPSMNSSISAITEVSRTPRHNGSESRSSMAAPTGSDHGSNNNSISVNRPQVLIHQHSDPVGLPSQGYETSLQGYDLLEPPNRYSNRFSVSSLIDLDESVPDSLPELARPSTANSDAMSISGSEIGLSSNPFELERHAPPDQPLVMTNREPSIYVSDDSELAHALLLAANNNNNNADNSNQQQQRAPTGLGLVSSSSPPSLLIHGVHSNSGGSFDLGSGLNLGEPDDKDGRQRREIESYLHSSGGYAGDDGPMSHQSMFTGNNGSSSGSNIYRGDTLSARGRGDTVRRDLRGHSGSFGSYASRSNGTAGLSLTEVGTAYSADNETGGDSSDGGLTLHEGGDNRYDPSQDGSASDGWVESEFVDAKEFVSKDEALTDTDLFLPPLPAPPSPHVMQGLGTRSEMREEMTRLLDSFKRHLISTNAYVTKLPLRRAGVGTLREDTQVEE